MTEYGRDVAIDRIYDQIDSLLCSEAFVEVDRQLAEVVVEEQSSEVLVAWLVITLGAKHRLTQRKAFVERARKVFVERETEGDLAVEILCGLE